jgi:hypothetical protein
LGVGLIPTHKKVVEKLLKQENWTDNFGRGQGLPWSIMPAEEDRS